MQKLYTLTSDEVESLSFYQQSIRTTASNIGKLIDKIEDGETHTEKIKYKIDEIIYITNTLINLKFEDNYPEYAESIYNKLAEIVEIVG